MRDALARSNLDLIMAEEAGQQPAPRRPRRVAAGAKPRPAASPSWKRRLPRRPMRALAIASFGALLFGILVNAVALQKGRHPAPLFAAAPRAARHVAIARASRAPARIAPKPAPAMQKPAAPAAAPAAAGDALGALIHKETADIGPVERLYSIQRALRQLGYPVRATGRMDGATRTSLARFERTSGLPASETPTARVLHALATRSGVHIR